MVMIVITGATKVDRSDAAMYSSSVWVEEVKDPNAHEGRYMSPATGNGITCGQQRSPSSMRHRRRPAHCIRHLFVPRSKEDGVFITAHLVFYSRVAHEGGKDARAGPVRVFSTAGYFGGHTSSTQIVLKLGYGVGSRTQRKTGKQPIAPYPNLRILRTTSKVPRN